MGLFKSNPLLEKEPTVKTKTLAFFNAYKKIIAVVVLVAALAVAFKLGSSSSSPKTAALAVTTTTVPAPTTTTTVAPTTTTTAPAPTTTTTATAPKPVVIYVPAPTTTTTAPKPPVVGTCFLPGYNEQMTKADCISSGGQQWSPQAYDYQGTRAGWLVTPPLTPAPTTTTTTAPAPRPKSWVTVATFSGTGSLNGAPFTLQGGQQRITWTCNFVNGHNYQSTNFDVMDDSHSGESSLSNECNQDPAAPGTNGSNLLYLPAGPWHFGINSTPYVTWTVKLEELR